jgi:hypothetical protein
MAQGKRERTEKTRKGFEVRIPKRGEFFSNLKKIAHTKPSGSARRPKK